jgi:hypothetical protein
MDTWRLTFKSSYCDTVLYLVAEKLEADNQLLNDLHKFLYRYIQSQRTKGCGKWRTESVRRKQEQIRLEVCLLPFISEFLPFLSDI